MPRSKGSRAIDMMIGAQLRLRRKTLGLSQASFAAKLGLTFQMIHRYERGSCRMSASMLCEISEVLDVPISFFFFFGSLPSSAPPAPDEDALSLSMTHDARVVAAMFPRIPDPEVRHVIAGLIAAAADTAEAGHSP